MINKRWLAATISLGALVGVSVSMETEAHAQSLFGDSMTVTVRTGGDDLRDSSSAMISVQHADGSWSTEQEFSVGGSFDGFVLLVGEKLSDWSTYTKILSNWDGMDPCATNIRVRLQQGSCFLCTDDNWNIDSLTLDYSQFLGSIRQLASFNNVRLTGSSGSFTVATNPPPAGNTCLNNQTVDCSGRPFDSSVLSASPPFDQDNVCDDGSTGFNFMCEAFLFDSGACGVPNGWPPACNGFYQDGFCDCTDCGGIWDPDCNDPSINNTSQTVFGCSLGASCVNKQTSPGNYAPTCVVPPQPPR